MKAVLILIFGVALFTGCTKEQITFYYAYLKNTTTHKIEIKPYSNGSVNTANIITLLSNENKEIANGTERGISNGGFISPYFAGADSLVVVFDNTYSIVHYGLTPANINPKHYLFLSPRNVGNWRNYQLTTRDISRYKRENIHVFDFIEQDYLDAR